MNLAATNHHLFWITSRAAGTATLIFSSLAVALGLVTALKLVRGRGPDLRVTHEALSLATMAAIAAHALSLLGDSFLRLSLVDVLVPFVSGYGEPWMSIGIVSGWALIILGLSYYLRGRIGMRRWRRLHRFTSLAWVLGIAHSLGEGTDAGVRWFLVCTAIAVIPAALLLAYRLMSQPETHPVTG